MAAAAELILRSPVGAEPAVFRWPPAVPDVQDEALEIIDTIRIICEEVPQLKQFISTTVLDNCDPASYNSLKGACDCYNQALDNVLRETGQVHLVSEARPSTELLQHIMQQCYRRAVTNPDNLKQYRPFSPEVYGETSFELVDQMIRTIEITADDKFIDLGSGVGQVVLQVAAATPCKCFGIEKSFWPALYAKQMELEYESWMRFYGKESGSYRLQKGDFLGETYQETISSATIIFVNNFAFGPQVDHELKQRFANMKEGAKIVSSKAFCPLNFHITGRNLGDIGAMMTVRKLSPLRGKVSWTDKPVTYYLHTIDRTMLEEYFSTIKNPELLLLERQRRDRLGRVVALNLEDSQGSDSGSSSPVSVERKRYRGSRQQKQKTQRSDTNSDPATPLTAQSPVAEDAPLPIATSSPAAALQDDTPTSTRTRKHKNNESVRAAVDRQASVGLRSLRLRLRTRKRRHSRLNCTPSPHVAKKKSVSTRMRSKLSAAMMDMLRYFHQQVLLTTSANGYNSNEAFNDRRLVEIARLVPFGPLSGENTSQNDSSLPVLNTAVCHPETPTLVDVAAPAADKSTPTDLTLGVSVPVSLAAGLSLTKTMTEAEPVVPKLKTPVDQPLYNPPPGVNPDALHSLEMLLESFRRQYVHMLEVMATSQYRDQILAEIKLQSDCRDRLQSRISELEKQIGGLLNDGVNKLHHRLYELGTPCSNPAQFVDHANGIMNRHRYLRACATSLYSSMLTGAEAEATGDVSQSVSATRMHSRDTAPVPLLNCTPLPTWKHTVDQTVDSSLFSSPDLLERCVVSSDLSCGISPATNSSCITPPAVDIVTPQSASNSCKYDTCEDVSDVRETPLSVRSVRKRKHQKRRLHKSTLPGSRLVDCSETVLNGRGSVATDAKGCSSDVTVKVEPKMPKLLPEPRIQYNPETPLRISIHFPLNGVISAPEDELLNEDFNGSEAVHSCNDNHEMCSAGVNSAMPVDLTSRASVHVPLPSSASLAADRKHYPFVGSASSSVQSAGPVYSPISSTSSWSTPDSQTEGVSSPVQEMPQPPVGIIGSFLSRFSGISAESLQFSPSTSFWTHSFAKQLAEVNQDSFAHNLPAPVLSPAPVTTSDQHMTSQVNCQRTVDNSFHRASPTVLVPISSSVVNGRPRHDAEMQDCMAVLPTIAVDTGLNRVLNIDLSNASQHASYKVDVKQPVISNGECHSSTEAVSLNGTDHSETDILPVPGVCQRKVSPNTARWQQQINSSFEALVNGALSPHLTDLHHQADCSDWRYAVEDRRSVCLMMDDLHMKDWSLRHLEQRSDSRDSGLESDAAAERHQICPTKKLQIRRSTEDRHSLHGIVSPRWNEQLITSIAPSNSPTQFHTYTAAQNCQLYGVLGKKKLHTALKIHQDIGSDKLTNGFASYNPCTQDNSKTTVLRRQYSASPLCDMSKPHGSKSQCLTR